MRLPIVTEWANNDIDNDLRERICSKPLSNTWDMRVKRNCFYCSRSRHLVNLLMGICGVRWPIENSIIKCHLRDFGKRNRIGLLISNHKIEISLGMICVRSRFGTPFLSMRIRSFHNLIESKAFEGLQRNLCAWSTSIDFSSTAAESSVSYRFKIHTRTVKCDKRSVLSCSHIFWSALLPS